VQRAKDEVAMRKMVTDQLTQQLMMHEKEAAEMAEKM
jgi:hypothetical protein